MVIDESVIFSRAIDLYLRSRELVEKEHKHSDASRVLMIESGALIDLLTEQMRLAMCQGETETIFEEKLLELEYDHKDVDEFIAFAFGGGA